MSHIVAATDFSGVAQNAVHYACKMAQEINQSVTVIHAFIIPVTFSDNPLPIIPIDESREIAEERMQQIVADLGKQYADLNISYRILFGDVVDVLGEYAEEHNPSMIVLGNSGGGDSAMWLGSNVVSTLRNLRTTTIAVPVDGKYTGIGKICFACDFRHITDKLPSKEITRLTEKTGARLHILNIDFNNKHFNPENPLETSELHQSLASLDPVYHFVENEHTDEAIQSFVDANQMDWLMIMPHKHGFFEGLFHKGHTKAMVKMSHVPIVAVHELQ
jgi:nucleotide-binding universal stress UspA family protein